MKHLQSKHSTTFGLICFLPLYLLSSIANAQELGFKKVCESPSGVFEEVVVESESSACNKQVKWFVRPFAGNLYDGSMKLSITHKLTPFPKPYSMVE